MTISLQTLPSVSLMPLSTPPAIPAATPPTLTPVPSHDSPAPTVQPPASVTVAQSASLKAKLGHYHNLKTLADKLNEIALRLGPDASTPAVQAALKTTPMDVHPDSAYHSEVGGSTSVDSFINRQGGLLSPYSHLSLTGLSDAMAARSQAHPLGNLGGALSWPVPLSADEQQRLRSRTLDYTDPLGQKQPLKHTTGGVLEFLRHRTPLAAEALTSPGATLNALVSSPEAQSLGHALQEQMQGIATDSSSLDYLLAAVILQLDPESITAPQRNNVAGFDLADDSLRGKSAAQIVDALRQHLVAQGKTSPELAGAAAQLLLAGRAPVFLVKDIPDSVTFGSPAWVNLAIAATMVDAHIPGRVANMSFAAVMLEAEHASGADVNMTNTAQRNALIDWGTANGLLEKKAEHLYASDELNNLVTRFSERQSVMLAASEAFDKDIPSRKAMALAELKQRFPDKEALFEEPLIRVTHMPGGDIRRRNQVPGVHSLLDVAMMDVGPDAVYGSRDSRIPVGALNANPEFGVATAFESQFKQVIEEKKNAVGTYIKHLISQLPADDRKNFEYGNVTFYQNHAHKLGLGLFSDKTELPKGEELLVRIERGGVTTAYEIDFNAGAIRSIPQWQAQPGSSRKANIVSETKVFTPSAGQTTLDTEQTPPGDSPSDTFASPRVQLIADAFVEHINLDDPAIKQQARGLTTDDNIRNRSDMIENFLLDLVPLRSAINHFRNGNIAEGLIDLSLDAFGIVTAGVGAAGKVVKIAGTTVSAATKVARSAKVIGMATFGAFNPLSGAGDLAVGGARLAGGGLKFLGAKGAQGVNALRGASGRYDLLKAASNEHGVVATGTVKIGEHSIDGAAVLKNGQWYAFDAEKMRAYGGPLQGFAPTTVSAKGQINQSFTDWLYKKLAGEIQSPEGPPTVLGQYAPKEFENELKRAQRPEKVSDFNAGYANGDPHKVPGFSSDSTILELQMLISRGWLGAEDVGTLVKQIERKKVRLIQEGFTLFQRDIHAVGGTLTPMPQEFYLSQVNLASPGECAGIANTLALAMQSGQETTYLGNMFKAAADPRDPVATQFIRTLRSFHEAVKHVDTFHMGKQPRQIPYHQIATELTDANPPRSLRIATKDHALLAGVMVRDDKPVWFYFDPNFGMAQFDSAEAMKNGLERTLNRGTSPFQHRAYGTNPGTPEYQVSYFESGDMQFYRDSAQVHRIASVPL